MEKKTSQVESICMERKEFMQIISDAWNKDRPEKEHVEVVAYLGQSIANGHGFAFRNKGSDY